METLTLLVRAVHRASPAAVLMVLGLLGAPGPAAAAEGQSLEQAVKATYLYKFGLFVEWPGAAFASANSAVNLCVVGEDPFGATLDNAVNGQRIGGREIAVRRLKTAGRESGCHILYAGGSEAQQVMAAVRGSGVLTITDAHAGTSAGIINFVIKDNRVRFNIDEAAAAQNGITISSKLLSLALDVKRKPSQGSR